MEGLHFKRYFPHFELFSCNIVEMEILLLHLSHFQPFNLCCLRFLFLIFTILILWIPSSCGACKEFRCGYYIFGYPFGRKNSGCGDPALQLECDEQVKMPLLNISGHQYYILRPSEYLMPSNKLERDSDHNLTIIDRNLRGDKCNPSRSNNPAQLWSSPQFHITNENKNLTLFKQCSPEMNTDLVPLPCNDSWYYYNSSKFDPLESKCVSHVVVPVKFLQLGPPVKGKFRLLGFQIKWNVSENCTECDSNGGYCAYDKTSTQFCRVVDNSKTKIIIIGCSIGGVTLVAVVMFFVFYVKRRNPTPTPAVVNNCNKSDMEAGRPGYMMGNLSLFLYQELEQATNFFDEENELGDGGFGAVYLGKLQDGRVVAVKRLYQQNSRRFEQFINEVRILSSIRHPNLVRLYGCTCPQSPVLLLVYEFVPNGTLFDHLHGSRRSLRGLPWGTRLNIAIDSAQALAYLHSIDPPIFHRDVKSNNILLDKNFRAKVADFGVSRLVPVNVSHVTTAPQGTPGYLDPEYHQCFKLTDKSDVYSFGVVLVELISAKLAVDTNRNNNEIGLACMAIDKIKAGALGELVDPDLKIEINHEVKVMVGAIAELAFECLARDRDSRPDMKEVLSRLEEIKQLQESKVSIKLISIPPTVSPISVQEKWPSVDSDQSTLLMHQSFDSI